MPIPNEILRNRAVVDQNWTAVMEVLAKLDARSVMNLARAVNAEPARLRLLSDEQLAFVGQLAALAHQEAQQRLVQRFQEDHPEGTLERVGVIQSRSGALLALYRAASAKSRNTDDDACPVCKGSGYASN